LARDRWGKDVLEALAHVSEADADQLIEHLARNSPAKGFLDLSFHSHGCRVLQTILEHASPEACGKVAEQLRGHAQELVRHTHANHVLQRLVQHCCASDACSVRDELLEVTVEMAQHPYGCRVLQELLEKVDCDDMIKRLCDHRVQLCEDPYGNYVIQRLLQHMPTKCQPVIDALCANPEHVCTHKIASNVVEKAIRWVPGAADSIIDVFSQLERESLHRIAVNQYGNFFVQRLLELRPSSKRLVGCLQRLPYLHGYGKHIQCTLQRAQNCVTSCVQDQTVMGLKST
jgi:hypothetical protein